MVGYGTQKKVTATGSVTSTKGEDILKSPSTNVSNNLAGRMPGLTAVSRSGEPGADDAILRIRGTNTLGDNSPLIVVDGVANRGLNRLSAGVRALFCLAGIHGGVLSSLADLLYSRGHLVHG